MAEKSAAMLSQRRRAGVPTGRDNSAFGRYAGSLGVTAATSAQIASATFSAH